MKTTTLPIRSSALALALAVLACLRADAQTWDGGDANNYWTNALNWVGDVVPAQDSAIVFNNASAPNLNNTLGKSFAVKSLTFGAAQTAPVTITTTSTNEALVFNPGKAVTVSAGSHKVAGVIGSGGTVGSIQFTYQTNAPTLGVSQSSNVLTFSWPAASSDYRLQAKTNGLLSGSWADYPGGDTSPVNVTINPANPSVFYRLVSSGSIHTFDIANGASLEFAGRLRRVGDTNAIRKYIKTGEGTLLLSADNGGGSGWMNSGDIFVISQGVAQLYEKSRGNSGQITIVSNNANLQVNGREATPNGTLYLAGNGISGNGALEFIIGPNTANYRFDVTSLYLTADASIGAQSGLAKSAQIEAPSLLGPFTMTKVGPGSLEIMSVSSNTTWAGITVSGGVLIVSGPITNQTGGATAPATVTSGGALRVTGGFARYDGNVTVQSGGRVESGTTPGTITGTVTVQSGGTLDPGGAPGTLNINNSLTLNAGSTTKVDVSGAGTSDLVQGLTSVTYDGTLVVTEVTPVTSGQAFQLFSATTPSGNFSSISPPGPAVGGTWTFIPATGVLTNTP